MCDGYNLVLVARRADRLAEVAASLGKSSAGRIHVIAKDLTRAEAVSELCDELQRQSIAIDVLVCNAGTAGFGLFVEHDWPADRQTIDLNVRSVTELVHRILPGMVARKQGRILLVASTAAFSGIPYLSVYSATKAYLLSFGDSLAEELRGSGVTVTTLCPGPTSTEFAAATGSEHSGLFHRGTTSSDYVARVAYHACLRGKHIVIPGFFNWLLAVSSRTVPRSWATFIGRKLTEPVRKK